MIFGSLKLICSLLHHKVNFEKGCDTPPGCQVQCLPPSLADNVHFALLFPFRLAAVYVLIQLSEANMVQASKTL